MHVDRFAGKNSPLMQAAARVAEDHACSKSSEPELGCLGCARLEQARRYFELEVDVLAAELGRTLCSERVYEPLRGLVQVARVAPRHLLIGVRLFLADLDAAAASEALAERDAGEELGAEFPAAEAPEPLLHAQAWAVCPCCEGVVRWSSQEISEGTTGTCTECRISVAISLDDGFVTFERPTSCPACDVRALKKDQPGSTWFRGSTGVCTACGERVVMGLRCLRLAGDRR